MQFEALEKEQGGEIGVAAFNSETGETLEYRGDKRFAMCSTFKLLLVAAILSRVDAGDEKLDRAISYTGADLERHSPIARAQLAKGKLSIAEANAAAIQYSDNTAANLLLKSIGGPEGLTTYLRSMGDSVTRLDRYEPALNSNIPGDLRDTTTPLAMVDTMKKLLIGDALTKQSRDLLNSWLLGSTTGENRLRAGVMPNWKVGDKTGSGQNGAAGDVAIIWPPDHPPFLVAVYYSGKGTPASTRDEVIAAVGRIISAAFYPER